MIIIWGAPVAHGASEVISDWENCIDKCLEEDDCLFLERTDENGCNFYRFGNVLRAEKLEESSGKKIAIKLEIDSETCPSSPDPPLFSGIYEYLESENIILYTTTITSNGSFLDFHSEMSYPPCPPGSRRFTRGGTKVCIQIRFFSNGNWCGQYANASALCRESNGISLTGPASDEEWLYIRNQSTKEIIMATGTPANYAKLQLLIWVDGRCDQIIRCPKDNFTMEDNTHFGTTAYQWSAGSPNSGNNSCLYFPYQDKIDDTSCYRTINSEYCFRGAACRIEPLTDF